MFTQVLFVISEIVKSCLSQLNEESTLISFPLFQRRFLIDFSSRDQIELV